MDCETFLSLASAAVLAKTGKPLSTIEVAILQGACLGNTYEQIADVTRYSPSYLSRTAGPQLWKLLSEVFGESITKKNVLIYLERLNHEQPAGEFEQSLAPNNQVFHLEGAGDSRVLTEPSDTNGTNARIFEPVPLTQDLCPAPTSIDWGEAIDVTVFYGRSSELERLNQWISADRCRLIAILGMGGVGKTALSVKLGQNLLAEQLTFFEFVIWRSLRNAPPLDELLTELVPFLSNQQETQPTLGKLMNCLRQSRCLVILDNLETLLDAERAGQFRAGFEGYGELLRLVGEVGHQSCVVLTSREKPAEVAALEGSELAVRSLRIEGSPEASQAILEGKQLFGTVDEKQELGDRYGNSPLALKIVATSIQELFNGKIYAFLQEDTFIFNGIRRLLDQQFNRLSPIEQSIMYWLAINREWTDLAELQADIVPIISKSKLLENLEALSFRCLIEQKEANFTQQPVVMEYITERIIDAAFAEIEQNNFTLLTTHALLKAHTKDYIRESQRRLILDPLAKRLVSNFHSPEAVEQAVKEYLRQMQRQPPQPLDYGAGNLINLLCYLNANLTEADFSGLILRQVYLRETPLKNANFTNTVLKQAAFAELLTDINSLAFSPDGSQLAMMGLGGTLFLYEAATGQRLFSLTAHNNWSIGLVYSPDGRTLFTGSFDQTIKQWDVNSGQCLQVWQTDSPVWQLALSHDGQWLASGHENNTIQIRNIITSSDVQVLTGHTDAVRGLAFHPQGNLLASGSVDHSVKVWDIPTGTCLYTCQEHGDALWLVKFNTQGTYIASASMDGTAKLWAVKTGTCLRTFPSNASQVNGVAFSPDGQLLACACQDTTIRLWDIQSNRLVRVLQGHRMGVWGLIFDADGETLISSSGSAQVKFWQVKSGQCFRTLQGEMLGFWAITFNAQGTLMASGGDDARLRLWSVAERQCVQTLLGHQSRIIATAFHPHQDLIATSDHNGLIKLWDIQGHCLQTLQGTHGLMGWLAFHPVQPLLLSCGLDCVMQVWSTETGKLLRTIPFSETASKLTSFCFHPQSHLFATSSEEGTVRIFESASGQLLQVLSENTVPPWRMAFHPQQNLLASAGPDGTVRVWDLDINDCVAIWDEAIGAVYALTFSPDGQLLAAAGDHNINIWDIVTQKSLPPLVGHTNSVTAIAFQPNPPVDVLYILASASYDETLRFWNVQTASCLNILRPDRIYEGMNITQVSGISTVQKAALKQLGAIEA